MMSTKKRERSSSSSSFLAATETSPKLRHTDANAWIVIVQYMLLHRGDFRRDERLDLEDLVRLASACRDVYHALRSVKIHVHSLFYEKKTTWPERKHNKGLVCDQRIIIDGDQTFCFDFETYESGYDWMHGPDLKVLECYEFGKARYVARAGRLFATDVESLLSNHANERTMPMFRQKVITMPNKADVYDGMLWDATYDLQTSQKRTNDDKEDQDDDDSDEEEDNGTWMVKGCRMRVYTHHKHGLQLTSIKVTAYDPPVAASSQ